MALEAKCSYLLASGLRIAPRAAGRTHLEAEAREPVAGQAAAGSCTSGLQISDSTTDVVILRIAGGPPERSGHLVLEGNQGSYPTGAASAQILLTSPRQSDPDALPPMPFANGEPIHVPSPPVPAGNQSTDNLTTALGDQKGGRGAGDQALDVIQAVRGTCVLTPRLSP